MQFTKALQHLGDSPAAITLFGSWDEESSQRGRAPVRISDKAYAEFLSAAVLVCTDALIVCKDTGVIYLTPRKAKPMSTPWMIGGRRNFGESPIEAMVKRFARETSLTLPADRFIFLAEEEYLFKDRLQEPQNAGTHTLSHTFVVELTTEEIEKVSAALDPEEYDTSRGLLPFSEIEGVEYIHPVFYDLIEKYRAYVRRRSEEAS